MAEAIQKSKFNSLAPGRFQWNFREVIFKFGGWDFSCEIALRWMLLDLIKNKSTLVQVMAWCLEATSHYLSQCWPRSILPYGIIRPQWVNSLWPNDAIWRQRSGSTLAQVMACCLMAPSHYWTNVDLPSARSIGIHLSTILQEILQPSIT